jgi:hypothetical protein
LNWSLHRTESSAPALGATPGACIEPSRQARPLLYNQPRDWRLACLPCSCCLSGALLACELGLTSDYGRTQRRQSEGTPGTAIVAMRSARSRHGLFVRRDVAWCIYLFKMKSIRSSNFCLQTCTLRSPRGRERVAPFDLVGTESWRGRGDPACRNLDLGLPGRAPEAAHKRRSLWRGRLPWVDRRLQKSRSRQAVASICTQAATLVPPLR